VEKVKSFEKPDFKVSTRMDEPDKDDNLSPDDLLKQLNLPNSSTSSSAKPKIVEVTNAQVKKPQIIKHVVKSVKPVKQGETCI
jgi:hypothetical protein